MPLFGPPNVEKLKARGNVSGLIEALGYRKKPGVREAAARALGEIGDERAVEPLIAALKDEVWSGGKAAAEALERIGTPAVDPLIAALKDLDYSVYQTAIAEVLGRIGDAQAMKPLIAALRTKKTRQAAVRALDGLGWQPDRSEAGAAYWIAKRDWDRCVEIGTLAVGPLIAALKDEDRGIHQAAAEALAKIGDARAVDPLIAALKDAIRAACPTATTQMAEIRKLLAMLPISHSGGYRHPAGSGDLDAFLRFLDAQLADRSSCRWDKYDPGEFIQHVEIHDYNRSHGISSVEARFPLPVNWAYEELTLRVERVGNSKFEWMLRLDTSAGDM
jgi:hypothetical protein